MRILLFVAVLSCVLADQPYAQPGAQTEAINALGTTQTVAASNRDAQWRPTTAQVESVQLRTRTYFGSRDSGRLEDAYSFFAPSQKSIVPFATWRKSIESFNARAGIATSRTMRKVTWYKDSPQGRPGTYAAVDFHRNFPTLPCTVAMSYGTNSPMVPSS